MEFENLTQRQFFNLLIGWNKKQTENFKNSWEQIRQLAFITVSPYVEKKQQLTPKKIMSFPWDRQEEKNEKPSKKAVENTLKKWDKIKFKKQE